MSVKLPALHLLLLFTVLAHSTAFQSIAQQHDKIQQILDPHANASGLYSRIKINTLISYGVIEQMGSTLNITILQKRPNKYRMDVHFEEGRITQAYDGKKGWSLNPFVSADTIGITGMELLQLQESALFDGVLFNAEDLGFEISLLADEKIITTPSYVLLLKKPNGDRLKFFIDQKDFLIKRTEASLYMNGLNYVVSSEFSNFKEVDGMKLPFLIRNNNGQLTTKIVIDHVRTNEPLEDGLFSGRR